jgi:transporter family-2 protein
MLKNLPTTYTIIGTTTGLILAAMIFFNGALALHVHPYWASAIVHGVGFIFGMLLYPLFPLSKENVKIKLSWWNFLGGISGGLTVVLASTAINSNLGVSGTVAFMLFGQIIFSLISDHFGLLGLTRRRVNQRTFIQLGLVSCGCALILMSNHGY